MIQRILRYSFYLLFFLTPLVWTSVNYELFEYNKMMFVYLMTVIITGVWVTKMVNQKSLILNRTPLDIPILLFLAANILSTIFSIDTHTSIWGYYSRSNGGLLSLISYLFLYYALASNFNKEDVLKFLKAALFGGMLVALWAIPEHFGISLSCFLLNGQLTASCWVQDVQARVFATLGQPNWLAAYLAMLIFPTLYFYLTAKTFISRIVYFLSLIAFYMAFTFTYSRGAILGLMGGFFIFIILIVLQLLRSHLKGVHIKLLREIRPIFIVLIVFLIINLLFGSSLTGSFRLFKEAAPPPRPTIGSGSVPQSTQLETGGTESGQIRLIVWRGALEIFKHYPIFGSGVETFAYSYYNFRPTEHNLVSEWDFLYNKAHNEYLNYLATTGIVGFLSYVAIILTFIIWFVRNTLITHHSSLITTSLLASYISYLVQDFFGFSVVIIAMFFYLFPALAFVQSGTTSAIQLKKLKLFFLLKSLLQTPPVQFISQIRAKIIQRETMRNIAIISTLSLTLVLILLGANFWFVILVDLFLLVLFLPLWFGIFIISSILIFVLLKFWVADTLFALGTNYSNAGNPGRAYNALFDASSLNPDEPFYRSELSFAAASAAVVLQSEDATSSNRLKNLSIKETDNSLKISPQNVSFWRTAIRTYYMLSDIDPSFNQKTLDTIDKTISLAPTDAKLYYSKAQVLTALNKNEDAAKVLEKAIKLKPNYRDAYYTLGEIYAKLNQKVKAINEFKTVLKIIPNDPDALKKLEELKGV